MAKAYIWRHGGDAILVVAVGVVCLYQVALNYQVYQKGATRFSITEDNRVLTPPILLCAYFPLDPRALLQFGLNLDTSDINEAKTRMDTLAGVAQNTSLQELVLASRWRLGQIVEELWMGDEHHVYDFNTTSSPLWQIHHYDGPCHYLKPRPVRQGRPVNLTLQVRSKQQFLTQTEEKFKSYPNISVAQQLLVKFFNVEVFFPSLSVNYMRSREASPRPYMERRFVVDSYTVRLMQQREGQDPDICKRRCHEALQIKYGYCLLLPPSPDQKVGNCTILMDTSELQPCLQNCRSRTYTDKWLLRDLSKGKNQFLHEVTLANTHRLLREEEIYPLQKFMSDLGGSLCLFLGVSLASLLASVRTFREQWQARSREKEHSRIKVPLDTLTINFVIMFLLGVHAASSFHQLVRQPAQTSVTLEAASQSSASENLISTIIHDSLALRQASRTFGCQLPTRVEALLQCILLDKHPQILSATSFLSLHDLPVCDENVLEEIPMIKYIIPEPVVTRGEIEEALIQCHRNQNLIIDLPALESPVRARVNQEKSIGLFRTFVEVGGIIGLYFGLSIYFILKRVLEGEWSKKSIRLINVILRWAGVVLALMAAYVCINQLLEFLYSHPVSSTTSSIPVHDQSPLQITVCPWPPIDRRKFLVHVGHSSDGKYNSTAIGAEWTQTVANLAQNLTLFQDAWASAQWNLTQLISNYFHEQAYIMTGNNDSAWRKTSINGLRCFTYTPHTHSQPAFIFVGTGTSGPDKFYAVHYRDEKPFFSNIFIDEVNNPPRMKYIREIITYQSLGYENEEAFGNCFDRCLMEGAAKDIHCPLPLLDIIPDSPYFSVPSCNVSFVFEMLEWAFTEMVGEYPKPMNAITFNKDSCMYSCRRNPKTLLLLGQEQATNGYKPLVTQQAATSFVVLSHDIFAMIRDHNLDSRVVVREYDGYTASQLVSDVGGVLGVLLGASILALLRGIANAITTFLAGSRSK